MRFVIDNAMSPVVVAALVEAGHDAVHVRDIGLATAEDEVIFDWAKVNGRTVVSQDTDFGDLLAQRHSSRPSVILFRRAAPREPMKQAALLLANLPGIESDVELGSIVIIERLRVRVRRLPLYANG